MDPQYVRWRSGQVVRYNLSVCSLYSNHMYEPLLLENQNHSSTLLPKVVPHMHTHHRDVLSHDMDVSQYYVSYVHYLFGPKCDY